METATSELYYALAGVVVFALFMLALWQGGFLSPSLLWLKEFRAARETAPTY